MEIKGKKIKKRYILVVLLVALIVPRCVQMNMEETALKEKLTAGGFEDEYEMENIVGSGFTTKAEFEQFIRTTPIPSIEGESAVQCAAVASFWEDRELSLKSDIGDLTPKSIRSVLNGDLIYDYAVGKTTNTILTARRDFLIKQLEQQFERAGVSESLKASYLECHSKFGPYVEKKCGATGVCEESTELLGLDGKPLSDATESVESSRSDEIGSSGINELIVDGAEFYIDSDANYENQITKYGEYAETKWREYSSKLRKPLCDDAICISISDYQYLCEKATGVTKKSIDGITMYDSVTKYLIDNASFDGAEVEWETFTTTDGERAGRCIVTVSASGLYEGSSRRDSAQAQVTRFAVVGGDVLVATAFPTYTNYVLKK